MSGSTRPIAIVIGLPRPLRGRVEAAFHDLADIHPLFLERDGGWMLELVPLAAAVYIESVCLDDVTGDRGKVVVLLPYVDVPTEVIDSLGILQKCDITVVKPKSNEDGWPAKPHAFDNAFQTALLAKLVDVIRGALNIPAPAEPTPEPDPEHEIMSELLRGLINHDKMGPTLHSHEDDFWKCRGDGLRPKQRHQLVMKMMTLKLIDRKKNNSQGGNGWVYWVDDIDRVRAMFPELVQFLDN